MKQNTHPEYHRITVVCTTCGNEFETGSTAKEIRVDSCSKCHPFYTGNLRFGTAEGHAQKFMRKYGLTEEDLTK
jgi:large subunit ribosomal protein L31